MSQIAAVTSVDQPLRQQTRIRLPYLDGLRGLAALYVVYSHVYTAIMYGCDGAGLSSVGLKLLSTFKFGHYMVDLFIVLSGYVLGLPIVTAGTTINGGSWKFFVKRFVRIIPPFYVSLILAFVVAQLPAVIGYKSTTSDSPIYQYLAHIFLVNNWSHSWRIGSNQPLWSVAVEWQIYMILPLILLPIWKKFGVVTMTLTAIVSGVTFTLLTGGTYSSAHTWFVGLFALGLFAAEICHGTNSRLSSIKDWNRLRFIPPAALVFVTIANRFLDFSESKYLWLGDTIVGIGCAVAIICLTQLSGRVSQPSVLIALLTSKPVQFLGTISYSVYLFHWPILEAALKGLVTMNLTPNTMLFCTVAVIVPVIVFLCSLLSALVEQPMIRLAKRLGS